MNAISAGCRSVKIYIAFIVFSLFTLPLSGTDCTCSLQIPTLAPPDMVLKGTSTGTCEGRTRIEVYRPGGYHGINYCTGFLSCNVTHETATTCLRTGLHTAYALCDCGIRRDLSNGNWVCDFATGTDSKTFFVDSTPKVGMIYTQPDADGKITVTTSYNFPNTVFSDPQRRLRLFADGGQLAEVFGEASGTWTRVQGTACWAQGSHQLVLKGISCNEIGDPDYESKSVGTIQVDHRPRLSVESVEPLDPANPQGSQVAKIHYDFQQTVVDIQRELTLRVYPPGSSLGTIKPLDREGTWTKAVACSSGYWIEATGLACPQTDSITAKTVAALPNCPRPPRKDGCGKPGEQCCLAGGAGPGGGGPGFGGKSGPPGLGPGARLHYLAGGAGSPGNPGQAAWNTILGRGWSHDYAERIVSAGVGRAWLITRYGNFREYTDAANDGFYEKVSPEDEYRTLTKTATGWTLRDLDGTVALFDLNGLWKSTADRNGNTKTATYTGGRLTGVTMPDGRGEAFAYHSSGKLASITEIGVGGAAQRTWSLTWSGNDLVEVSAPDGTAQRFIYASSFAEGYPGYMIRRLQVGTDGSERVEAAWEYDGIGNVVRTWRGSQDFATGIERHEFAYDNPIEPTQTTLTIHRNETEREVVVYTLSRTAAGVGAKPRVTSISGDCTSCGLAPNSQLFYDDPGNPLLPTRILDSRGTQTLLSYDARGRLVSRTEAAGTPLSRTTTWTYSAAFPALPTRIEAPSTAGGSARRVTVMTYDAAGNLTSSREQGVEAGSFFDLETVTTFHASGRPLSVNPPGYGNGDETSFAWDSSRGSLVPLSRTEPLAGTTTFEHDPFNRQTAVTDPNGLRTVTTYDGLNRVLTVTRQGATTAEDLVTTYQYNAFGDLLRTTLPRGNLIEYGYDGAGRLISIEKKPDAATPGERKLYTLDQAGHRIREELQRWKDSSWLSESWTEYQYRNRCQVGKVVHADGKVTEYAYDCGGNLEKVWDANHPRSTNPAPTQLLAYDALDRLTSMSQPWTGAGGPAAVTSYSYDAQDHLTAVTDPEGNTTTYVYSDRDLMTRESSPVSGVKNSAYNEHGEPATRIDAAGVMVTRTLDALDRVTAESYPDSSLHTTFTYDTGAFAKGRLTGITRQGTTVSYAYDRFGRITQDGSLSYGYDKNGNRRTIGYPNNIVATYNHDFADREQSLTVQAGAGSPLSLATGATYKPFGPLAGLSLGNGLTETRVFSGRYFPAGIHVPGRLQWTYTTDSMGNITAITDNLNAANNRTYGYRDPQYFLTSGNGPWGTRSWSHDRTGNRLTETRGTATDTYTYIPNGTGGNTPEIDQIVFPAGSPVSYAYDEAGDVLNNGTLSFAYGQDRRVSQITTSGYDTLNAYDGRGYLSRSTYTLTSALYSDETVPTYSSGGLLFHRFAHRNLQPFSRVNPVSDSHLYVFYFAGRPVATLDNVTQITRLGSTTTSTWQYLTVDHLGTPILVTNPSGGQVWQGGLEPFGIAYNSPPTVLRFPGQWLDATWNGTKDLGLYYNVHRWYDAKAGRYTSPDPLSLRPGENPYPYAVNNPVRWRDPLGLDYWIEGGVMGEGGLIAHQSICVGDPELGGERLCISFGTGERSCRLGCPGQVYEDTSFPGTIWAGHHYQTPEWIDDFIRRAFYARIGNTGVYNVITNNCRDYVQDLFNYIVSVFGGRPVK